MISNMASEESGMMLLPAFLCIFLISCVHGASARYKADPPAWPSVYTVSGILKLPYAEIKEPFYAYFDANLGRSRIDYYGDMVKTLQIPAKGKDFGKSYKVAPMTTEKVTNVKGCFILNGSKDSPAELQAVLPDLKAYQFVKVDTVNNVKCNLWQNVTVVGTRKNVYRFWVEIDKVQPRRFEMMGYDTLLGSHYDKYYLDYDEYLTSAIPPNVFEVNTVAPNLTCAGFPGPGIEDHKLLMNPMQEYINQYDDHIDPMFHHFKKHHGRNYNVKETHFRKGIFMHNLRFVHSTNRAGLSYRVAVNHLADWTDEERKALRGRLPPKGYNGGHPFNEHKYNLKDLPDQLDWRLYGAVTQVKDQAVCGSCWSFGTTGTIEGAHFLRTGLLVRLSQQELIDCSWGEGNNGCDGGEDFRAYKWITKHGLAAEDAYGHGKYLGQDSYCAAKNATPVVKTIKAYYNVTSGDAQALKIALAYHGPISISIDAAVRSFSFYANGVYYDPKCGKQPADLDHSVLAVGYGAINGQGYWLVKNSWSTYWGNDGYILISQKDNICGVATDPTFVVL